MMEKYKPGDEEFDLPQRVLELYRTKDYGPYTYGNELRVCFTASNQTTGGNSGSPVLDARGYLIGVNFDRSWESTMSDVMYDPERCRNIILDIRYVLFVIDKVAGASHLLKEMELMTPEKIQEAENEKKKAQVLSLTEEIRSNPDNSGLLMRRAAVYSDLKMFTEAEADLKSAIALQPKQADAIILLGSCYMDQYKFTEAIKEFDKAIVIDKTKAEALLQKGICLSELRKFEDAIKTFNQYIGLNRLDHRGYYNRGLCYYQTGKPALGCEDLLMAEKLGGRKSDWLRKELCD
jgi:tetratricopeptide (TPR) repeat protein